MQPLQSSVARFLGLLKSYGNGSSNGMNGGNASPSLVSHCLPNRAPMYVQRFLLHWLSAPPSNLERE